MARTYLPAADPADVQQALELAPENPEALELGASDCLEKPEVDKLEDFYRDLLAKVHALSPVPARWKLELPASPPKQLPLPNLLKAKDQPIHAIAIATSTGGPRTLQKIFRELNGKLNNLPIFITQHMPAAFTTIMAEQLTTISKMECAEAREGEIVRPGRIYIAPGDYHLNARRVGTQVILHVNQRPQVNFCRPSADPMFIALSEAYGENLLAVVLTGMGQDGADGAEYVVKNGGSLIAQDAASSIVYGMPRAVAERGICQEILPLDNIAAYLIKRCLI